MARAYLRRCQVFDNHVPQEARAAQLAYRRVAAARNRMRSAVAIRHLQPAGGASAQVLPLFICLLDSASSVLLDAWPKQAAQLAWWRAAAARNRVCSAVVIRHLQPAGGAAHPGAQLLPGKA